MILHDPDNIGERILFFGYAGVGKTYAIFTMMQYLDEDVTVYYIDNDDTFRKSYKFWKKEHGPFKCAVEHLPLDNLDWEGHAQLLDSLRDKVQPHDWVVLDMLTPLWSAAQNYYTDRIFGSSQEDYYLQVRKAKGDGITIGDFLDGATDWGTINKLYASKISNNLINMGCNIACTAEVTAIGREKSEDKDNWKLFGPLGVKPAGQKRVPHIFHSIILLYKDRDKNYLFTTVKDRGNVEYEDEPWEDWGVEWLRDMMLWEEKAEVKSAPIKKKVQSEEG